MIYKIREWFMKKLAGCLKKAVKDFDMIQEGDVVAVGLSGGKDSMLLLRALNIYQKFSPMKFELKAITVDLGFEGFDLTPIEDLCNELEIELFIEHTQIGKIVFDERKEKNPCSLCATMRRARINNTCVERGINKLALGHHGDDFVESTMMSMIYESRLHSFKPVTLQSRSGITVIRPFILAMETDVLDAMSRVKQKTSKNPCPASEKTKREYIKGILKKLDQENYHARNNMHRALINSIGIMEE